MEPCVTDSLCTRCGLCCDGSLFADVEVSERESDRLECLGLPIVDDAAGALVPQPCGALQGRRCSIYGYRPRVCRTFECRLLLDARSGAVSVTGAQRVIAEAHRRIAQLTALLGRAREPLPLAERCEAALALDRKGTNEARRAEIEVARASVTRLMKRRFLGVEDPARSGPRLKRAGPRAPGSSPGRGL